MTRVLKRDLPLRRKHIEYLCSTMGVTVEDLLRNHRSMLSHGLLSQARLMFFQEHGRFFEDPNKKEVRNDAS